MLQKRCCCVRACVRKVGVGQLEGARVHLGFGSVCLVLNHFPTAPAGVFVGSGPCVGNSEVRWPAGAM